MISIANICGGSTHISPLLRKARGLGLPSADSLLRLAVARGCDHYAPANFDAEEVKEPGRNRLSDAELGMAMISGAQDYDPQLIRCAAQLLSGIDMDAPVLIRLAKMERCEALLAYIAEQARNWDEGRAEFWDFLLDKLPRYPGNPPEAWPHPTRFMIQAGYRRGGGAHKPLWLRPRQKLTSR